ncbi:hypothetical protein QPK24_03605 [Paenibacillus polygoni]|uniref:Ser/Thr protein kinase RdoA involved in Cpx stress response, MazF antagonist n=1 Tax=Paenibacillus polygoni TaxID=3050112 RepID=A0ABY8X2T7_9BACL|nr:hypothetical protein [Paenibacillus polygoni]WIV19837.1 hypothetical protein QPK24_03605 [Paenibacillus polygoni]
MKIERNHISDILALYRMTDPITELTYFIERYYIDPNTSTPCVKVIVKANFENADSVVVKCINEEEHPGHIIEQQSVFSEHMRTNGIITPRRYPAAGEEQALCLTYFIENTPLIVSVEEYIGEEIRKIDLRTAYKIGRLMGEMHRIAERDNLHMEANSIFDVIGYNEASGYNRFKELGEAGHLQLDKYQQITEMYEHRMKNLHTVWSGLPRFATQGDYSINNLTWVGEEIGIFDYNIAGEATLVGDMVTEGLLTAYEMDLAEGLTREDKLRLFDSFIDGYRDMRKLHDAERRVLNDLYAVVSSMWFTSIRYHEDSLEKLLERAELDKINTLLEEMKQILSRDYFRV